MFESIITKSLVACSSIIAATTFFSATGRQQGCIEAKAKSQKSPAYYRSTWKKDPRMLRVGVIAFSPHGYHHTAAIAVQKYLETLGNKYNCKIIYLNTDEEVKEGNCTWYDKILPTNAGMRELLSSQRGLINLSNMLFNFREQFANTYDLYAYFGREIYSSNIEAGAGLFVTANIHFPNSYCMYNRHDLSQFDLIISLVPCIHNRMVYELPEIKQNKIPVISIPTDADQQIWGDYVDSPNVAYLLCSDAFIRRAKKMRVKEFSRISGLPLRPEFKNIRNISKSEMKERLGFDKNKPLILVDFGAAGQEQILEILPVLKDVNAVFICGRGQNLKKELERMLYQFYPEGKTLGSIAGRTIEKPNLRILGFVNSEEKAQYMRAADVIAGKAGGLTSFEALQCETPIVVLLQNILANEKPNVEVLLDYNCCKLISCWSELPYTIEEILSEPRYKEGPSKFVYSADEEISNFVKDIAENYEAWQKRLWENKEPISAESSLAEESISPAQ